jgi:hypothetical protein
MGAPLNPVPQVLRVFLEGFIDSINVQKWGNVLHFSYTGTPPTNAVCATIAQDIYTQWLTHMAPECPSPTELDSVTVTDLTSDTAGSGEFSTTGGSGTRGDDSIPANAAFLISYPQASGTKAGTHGPTFMCSATPTWTEPGCGPAQQPRRLQPTGRRFSQLVCSPCRAAP